MTEKLKISYPSNPAVKKQWSRLYGMNAYYSGKHWAQRKADAQFWHMLTRQAMDAAQCRKQPFEKPVIISFAFNDRLDCSNHAMMAKMIEDGMKGRIIADDTRRYVRGIEIYFHDRDYILVVVREIEGDVENGDTD